MIRARPALPPGAIETSPGGRVASEKRCLGSPVRKRRARGGRARPTTPRWYPLRRERPPFRGLFGVHQSAVAGARGGPGRAGAVAAGRDRRGRSRHGGARGTGDPGAGHDRSERADVRVDAAGGRAGRQGDERRDGRGRHSAARREGRGARRRQRHHHRRGRDLLVVAAAGPRRGRAAGAGGLPAPDVRRPRRLRLRVASRDGAADRSRGGAPARWGSRSTWCIFRG